MMSLLEVLEGRFLGDAKRKIHAKKIKTHKKKKFEVWQWRRAAKRKTRRI